MELMDRDCDERPPMKQWDVGILSLLVRRLIDWSRYFLFVCEKIDAFRSKNKNEMNGTSLSTYILCSYSPSLYISYSSYGFIE